MEELKQKNAELNEILQLVSFKLGDEEFGIDILKVQEINKMMQITKVPNAPIFIEGVVNLRGRIIPVICLRKRLNMKKEEIDNKTRIIVIELTGTTVGFIVDEVSEVLRIPKNVTEAPPAMVSGVESEYITAVGKLDDRLLILLDLEKIFTFEETKLIRNVN